MSLLVAHRLLSSCSAWASEQESLGSAVAPCRLGCPMACGILVPQPEIEPTSPALEGDALTTGPTREAPLFTFSIAYAGLFF